jgi:aminoglycoside phosphotransferase (APT) family kinase protein
MSAGTQIRSRDDIDPALVRRLIAAQFPQWAELPVARVEPDGWDNRTFHLGSEMSVRLPSHSSYEAQVEKEHRWLPRLAPLLPLPIPVPIAQGAPMEFYPWRWSVYRWLPGETAEAGSIANPVGFAESLAEFLTALYGIDPAGGPAPGAHSFNRGGPVSVWDEQTRESLTRLRGHVDGNAAVAVWDTALSAGSESRPVWVHGDVFATNLLVSDGRLSAVIDFGCSAVGDPACDLTIAWTFFSGASRDAFRRALSLDPATWARARGWALWKALITIAPRIESQSRRVREARRVLGEVLADSLQR